MAEVLTKAAFVAGVDDGVELVADAGAQGLLVTDDGTVLRTPDFGQFEVELAADDGAGPAGP